MSGGTIGGLATGDENSAVRGGGVYVLSGNFDMSGSAAIIGNKTTGASGSGGGVYFNSGDFDLSGSARISGNQAAGGGGGGGVSFDGGGTFTMSGGTIGGAGTAKNTAGWGGGVYVLDGDFDLSGSAAISGNEVVTGGGGVFIFNGTFDMSGGTIGGNIASSISSTGGGVYVDSTASAIFTMEGGTIYGGSAGANANWAVTGASLYKNNAGTAVWEDGIYWVKGAMSGGPTGTSEPITTATGMPGDTGDTLRASATPITP
jgi:hypothetical protein